MTFKPKRLQSFVKHRNVSWHVSIPRANYWGSIALHEGNIAEMKTGEGKT